MKSDVVIVGAGIVGLYAATAALHRGHTVTVVDPFIDAHTVSAVSGGLIRRFDLGGVLSHLAPASFDRLRAAAEAASAFHRVGSLTLQNAHDLLPTPVRAATTLYAAAALRQRWPQLAVEPNVIGIAEAGAGWIDAPSLLRAHRTDIRDRGAHLIQDRVHRILASNGQVSGILTDTGQLVATNRVLLTAGSASPALARSVGVEHPLDTRRIGYCFFRIGDAAARLPTVVDRTRGIWLRPCSDPDVVLAGRHSQVRGVPPIIEPSASTAEVAAVRNAVAALLPAVAAAPVVGALTAYDAASTPKTPGPIHHCRNPEGLTIAAGWNGSGFKSAPALADLALTIEGCYDHAS